MITMTATTTAGFDTVFGTDCDNCNADADVSAEVISQETGETEKTVYACGSCSEEIEAPAGYCVVEEAL